MNERLVFAFHTSRLKRSEMRDGSSQESKETLVSVEGSSHGTATAKLLPCFLVIMAKAEKGKSIQEDLLTPDVSLHVLPHMLQCIPAGQVCNRPFHARINRLTGHTGCIVHKHPFCVCQQGQHKLVLFPLTAGPGIVLCRGKEAGTESQVQCY